MQLRLSHFLKHPQDLGVLLFMGIAWSIAKLPLNAQLKLARALGKVIFKLAKHRTLVADTNLQLCFPEKTKEEREAIVKETIYQTALATIELAACWFSDLKSRKAYSTIIGKEHIKSAQAKGNGVILLIFHFTSMELGGCLMGEQVKFNAMYKPTKNKLVEHVMCAGRLRHIHALIKQDDIKGTVRALKNNQVVWYSTDQNAGTIGGVFVPFFGIPACTITALSRMAKMTGAAVVPFTHRRTHDGKGLELELHPALENFPGECPKQDAVRVNEFLEDFLRQEPANYMWIHQRFRTRPPGEPRLYPKRKG